MIVADKPRRARKRPVAVHADEEITPHTLTAYCRTEKRYTRMLGPRRRVVGGVVMTDGACACGEATFRVGSAGGGDGDALA